MLWISRDARIRSEVIVEAEVLSYRAGLNRQAAQQICSCAGSFQ